MSFDPTKPANGSPLNSGEMRNQLNGLHDEITSIPKGDPGDPGPQGPPGADGAQGPSGPQGDPGPAGPTAVIVDQNDPGGADGTVWIRPSDGNLAVRVAGAWDNRGTTKGPQGDPGSAGPEGPQGDPGEVTAQQLNDAIGGTARNPSGQMGNLDPNWTPSGDTNADLLWLRDRLVELYTANAR